MLRSFGLVFWISAVLLAGTMPSANAQQPVDAPAGYLTGFHIVRPDENLRLITRNYLGSEQLWQDNWRLNPEIEDPDFLLPGQRLRVLLRPEDSVPAAQIVGISGSVKGRPDPIAWTEAQRLDIMVQSDGVQTAEASSTALRFHDGTSLVVTEDSVVFLKVAGRTLRGIETRSVEIVEGQADLAGSSDSDESAQIEIVIGDATARPKAGAGGQAEARLRKSSSGAAQVMVYEGEGEVESAGQKVAVAEGMGTSVKKGAPPAPPEKLLDSPAMSLPEPGANLETGRLEFSWEPVAGAAGYVVEICADPVCEALVKRELDLASTSWQAEELRLGELHWRVTAVSPSGLDGFPAAPRSFTVVPERAEFDVPTATILLPDLLVRRSIKKASRTFYSPTARLAVEVEDPSGVASWQPVIDGVAADQESLAGGWSHGDHEVSVVAEDGLGNRGEASAAVSFTVDAEAPELSWRIGGEELLREVMGEAASDITESRRRLRRTTARNNARRVRKNRPPKWALLAWGNDSADSARTPDRSHLGLRLIGNDLRAVLYAPGIVDPTGAETRTGEFLVLEVRDEWAGIEDLTVTTVGDRFRGYELRARYRDRLGNAGGQTWRFSSVTR